MTITLCTIDNVFLAYARTHLKTHSKSKWILYRALAGLSRMTLCVVVVGHHINNERKTMCMNVLRIVGAVLAGVSCLAAAAEPYPVRPIRLVNPYSPGGSVDVVCRAVSQRLSDIWGQRVIVDNRPGAGTNIGTEIVVRAQPDGYTLLCNTGTVAINPSFYPQLPFNTVKELRAIALVVQTPNVLVVHPSVAAASVRELIDLARTRPGQLNFASSGTGSSTHLALELFKLLAKVQITHVAYKGGSQVLADLLGGQVQGAFNTPSTLFPHVKSGKIRALAIGSAKRSELAPDLPTLAESGVPDYEAIVWYALLGQRALPPAIVEKWNAEINRMLKSPDARERFVAAGLSPMGGSAREADEYFVAETKRWPSVIRAATISPDQ
jgi:tripartite-type tricarboxylate transporter receptor subunit TctC